jgi:short-subunit dehydrogenase
MNIEQSRVVLTGAAGGIGSALAMGLASRGARLLLVGRQRDRLESLAAQARQVGGNATTCVADLCADASRAMVLQSVEQHFGVVDLLINNAGILDFADFSEADPMMIARVIDTNLLAPILLTRALLPAMLRRKRGRIVNIGSAFGSIGYPGFSVYCASKFGLRGFSEALRRELTGTGIGITYVAPRSVRTAMNPESVTRLAEATKMQVDDPAWVADQIVRAIERDRDRIALGFPEKFFARINALWPGVVDGSIGRQAQTVLGFARD